MGVIFHNMVKTFFFAAFNGRRPVEQGSRLSTKLRCQIEQTPIIESTAAAEPIAWPHRTEAYSNPGDCQTTRCVSNEWRQKVPSTFAPDRPWGPLFGAQFTAAFSISVSVWRFFFVRLNQILNFRTITFFAERRSFFLPLGML